MAHSKIISIVIFTLVPASILAITCPGFPGYCSESFPGQSCTVVCARGRNNVPLCQEDGTWTDLPRCVEHDPGTEEQIAGLCPGISGYCSTAFYDGRCNFNCHKGPPINSVCTHDGTWEPYPTCQGDLRETQDGCDGCPGPNGKSRNRTAEAISDRQASNLNNRINHNRVPKAGSLDNDNLLSSNGIRKSVPSFAGTQKFGRIKPVKPARSQFPTQQNTPKTQTRPTQQSFNNQRPAQQSFNNQRPAQQSFNNQRPAQRPPPPPQRTNQRPPPPPQRTNQRPPPPPQRTNQRPPPPPQSNKGQSLFDQIQNRIKTQKSSSPPRTNIQSRVVNSPPTSRPRQNQPNPTIRINPTKAPQPQRVSQSRQPTQDTPKFGVFESVDLSNKLPTVPTRNRQQSFSDNVRSSGPSPPSDGDGFFGVFQEVNLQG